MNIIIFFLLTSWRGEWLAGGREERDTKPKLPFLIGSPLVPCSVMMALVYSSAGPAWN